MTSYHIKSWHITTPPPPPPTHKRNTSQQQHHTDQVNAFAHKNFCKGTALVGGTGGRACGRVHVPLTSTNNFSRIVIHSLVYSVPITLQFEISTKFPRRLPQVSLQKLSPNPLAGVSWRIFTLTSNNFNVHEIFVETVLRKRRCGKNWVLPADRENSFQKVCFFLARPSGRAWARTPLLSLYLTWAGSRWANTWQRVPLAFTILYQQNMAPIFVEKIPAPFHKVRTYCRYKGPRLCGNMLHWMLWDGKTMVSCDQRVGHPETLHFFPKIMTRRDENVICSLWCIAYACYRLPFLECTRSNIENNNTHEKDTMRFLVGNVTYREYVMQSLISPPLHICPKNAGCDTQNHG